MQGGCLCGQVRYQITGDPLAVATCHCENCQKQSGSALSVVVVLSRAALEISGDLKTYVDGGTSGDPVYRRFCSNCGSPVVTDTPAAEAQGIIFIKGGTVDGAAGLLKPSVHYWTVRQHKWLELPVGDPVKDRE